MKSNYAINDPDFSKQVSEPKTQPANKPAPMAVDLIKIERDEQHYKHGITVEADYKYNNNGQLIEAVRILMMPNIVTSLAECYKPNGWDAERWRHIYRKPHRERLIIAATFLAAERDRLDFEIHLMTNNYDGAPVANQ